MMDLNKLVELLQADAKASKVMLERWKKQLETNPIAAFSNSGDVMAVTALGQVCEEVLAGIERLRDDGSKDADILKIINEAASKTALEMVSLRSYSSSPQSNLMDDYIARAWAKIARFNGIWI